MRWGLAIVAAALASASTAWAATPRDTLIVAENIQGALTMDTGQVAEGNITAIFQSICDKLVRRDPADATRLLPGIAERWETSEDGRDITFHIRPGLRFPGTGNPVSAEDAVWSTRRIMKLGFGTAAELQQWGFTKANIEASVTVADPMTMKVHVPEPAPVFDVLYATFSDRPGFVLDRAEILKHEENGDLGNKWMQQRTACVGPYRLAVWKPSDVLVFERNDDYFDRKPAMKRLIFQNVTESGAQRLMVERGDADVAMNLNATDLAAIGAGKAGRVQQTLAHEVAMLAFNHGRKPFDDPRVVAAFRWLVDYEGLANSVYKGLGEVHQSLIPEGAFGALPRAEASPFRLDLAKAKALLTEAGYPDGFSANLWTITNGPGFGEIVQTVQENAAKVGVKLNVQRMSDGDLFPRYRSRDFDAVMVGWAALYPDGDAMVSRLAWNPDNRPEAKLTHFPTWRVDWADPWFNEMTLKERVEQDPARRQEVFAALQRRYFDAGPFVLMFQNYRSLGVGNAVKTLVSSPFTDLFGSAEK